MESVQEIHEGGAGEARRRGRLVFVALALLTAVEFAVSVWLGGLLPLLGLIALAKAALIVIYFMRVGDLGVVWKEEVRR